MSLAIVTTESRVMPDRIDDPTGGVWMTPSRMMKMFWPLPSLRLPSVSRAMPSA
jgi:hypothetical protein